MFAVFVAAVSAYGEGLPEVSFTFSAVDASGTEEKDLTSFEGSAPIEVTLTAAATYCELVGAWRVWHEGGSIDVPDIEHYENPTTVTLANRGVDSLAFVGYALYNNGVDTLWLDRDNYWWQEGTKAMWVKSYESRLAFPNAFSPNGDMVNDIYKAKQDNRSIVEFHAAIYSRWGVKLYEWDNVSGGWDGTYGGSPVKDGVYFLRCHARGADGQTFDIRRDVNLLRTYDSSYDEMGN